MNRKHLVAGLALAVVPFVALAQAVIPEPDVGTVLSAVFAAVNSKNWALLAAAAVVGVVFVLRKVGAKVHPWFATPRGGVVLLAVGGTGSLLLAALSSGQSFSASLLLGCINTALAASGLWSTVKNAAQTKTQQRVCDPIEIANRTCVP